METLKFETSLKVIPVILVDKNGVEKNCKLKELTGTQRSTYNDSFKLKIQMDDGKAKAVSDGNFKLPSSEKFLAMCLYDEKDVQISKEIIGEYPTATVEGLYKAAMKLSGINVDAKTIEEAKNE